MLSTSCSYLDPDATSQNIKVIDHSVTLLRDQLLLNTTDRVPVL